MKEICVCESVCRCTTVRPNTIERRVYIYYNSTTLLSYSSSRGILSLVVVLVVLFQVAPYVSIVVVVVVGGGGWMEQQSSQKGDRFGTVPYFNYRERQDIIYYPIFLNMENQRNNQLVNLIRMLEIVERATK